MKTCSKCGEEKALDAYYSHARAADGRRPDCKACVRARVKRRASETREERIAYLRAYYAANREKALAYRREYARAHPEAINAASARRRAKVRGNRVEPYDRAAIIARDLPEGCYLCGLPFDPEDVHIDHVDPIDNGGADAPDNVAATHPACNMAKGARPWPVVAWNPFD